MLRQCFRPGCCQRRACQLHPDLSVLYSQTLHARRAISPRCGVHSGLAPRQARLLLARPVLGIHSEMFSDGVIDLVERGVITGARKTRDRGKMVACFLMGSRRLMDFIDDNPMVKMYPVTYTNDPQIVRQFDHFVSVNSA